MFSKKPNTKMQSDAEKQQQAVTTANALISEGRSKLRGPLETHQKVATSTYWTYGYMGGTMMTTMAGCLVAGNKIQLLRSYASWIALAVGYYGGKSIHGLHNAYNVSNVVKVLDVNIEEMKRLDAKHGATVSLYGKEAQALLKMKIELQPLSSEAQEHAHKVAAASSMTIDDRAEELIAAFERRKKQ
ncbi:transmembrane protein, putative [Bodo saltans]|uniref:Transmembrane protein, putative n=1 Tax=Bodo saltans TaxID=75058 RepID=A0A0S4JB41_BODSA|nr:transmembrane protein, putative [Bodo saltans]|eukprot:CUG88697.1 transmembrane protein, putative [Bodo saltans]